MANQAAPVDRWALQTTGNTIRWNVSGDLRLPHQDHLEMSGRLVSVVVNYTVGTDRRLSVSRAVFWPTLRAKPKHVRGYLKHVFSDDSLPQIFNGEKLLPRFSLTPVDEISFDGILTITHKPKDGLRLTRHLLASTTQPAIVEQCVLENVGNSSMTISIVPPPQPPDALPFVVGIAIDNIADIELAPGKSMAFGVIFYAAKSGEILPDIQSGVEIEKRRQWLASISASLQFKSPDEILNRAFSLAKIRAADSIFQTKMGLVHSPGGERYYGGIWANDQAEYSGPFFPFLGDETANTAALNAYRIFAGAMNSDFTRLPCSFEVEGDVIINGQDRGDAAMIAYGAPRFALASGNPDIGNQLWPLVEWCLEYCRRKLTPDGIVASTSDELEGRFPTGDANLSTSTLAYGGLLGAANLARALAKSSQIVQQYQDRAAQLRDAIARYFQANIEGFETYRYHAGNTILRAWICLPLTMGILDRAPGTIAALFSPRLWTPDGVATQAGDKTFWDRSTLYALRGVFAAGATDLAMDYLQAYSRRRLLGDHVPYPVEAYPEGNQAHLSAESALYCRVITEGLFGIVPTGFDRFTCTPRLPRQWPSMKLKNIRAFATRFDILIERSTATFQATIVQNDQVISTHNFTSGDIFEVILPRD